MGISNSRNESDNSELFRKLFGNDSPEEATRKAFAEKVMALHKEHEQLGLKWEPWALHNKDGDMIEWYSERVSYYGDRVNEIITLYRAEDDDRIIGGCIKNIQYIMGEREKPSPRMD